MIITTLIHWCWSTTEHLRSTVEMLMTPFEFIFTSTFALVLVAAMTILCVVYACAIKDRRRVTSGGTTGSRNGTVIPESVNYHLTRQCNYNCGFCFHTAKTSFVLKLEDAKRGLKLLKDAGMIKINFSGGEPFLPQRGRFVGELVKFCKQELKLESVTIVSNGSLIKETWFAEYGTDLDILAVSCDSFNPDTNELIGRQKGSRNHLDYLHEVRRWCTEYKVAFKLNTVVNAYNVDEDLTSQVLELNPVRWKMRFLDGGTKQPSHSILDVGVRNAIDAANFDEAMFLKRGGKYTWSKADMTLDW